MRNFKEENNKRCTTSTKSLAKGHQFSVGYMPLKFYEEK
jgi:hypothetical protein